MKKILITGSSGYCGNYIMEELAKRYQMITLEKWYTPCGAQGPHQAGPQCHVEAKMATTFKAIKAANPNVTTLLYLNSMFNFAAYRLNGLLLEREARGLPSLLRDKHGKLVSLCNDGDAASLNFATSKC